MEQQSLSSLPVGTLMRRYAIPCIISLLVGALYNIVDQLFIANAAYLGSYGNAANTVVFPLTVIVLAVAVMIGDGCCAFVSGCFGKGDFANAKAGFDNAILLSVLSGAVLCGLYLWLADPLISLFGAHVNEDIAGEEEESWLNRLQAAGFSVRVSLKGLGEYPAFQKLYVKRLQEWDF